MKHRLIKIYADQDVYEIGIDTEEEGIAFENFLREHDSIEVKNEHK